MSEQNNENKRDVFEQGIWENVSQAGNEYMSGVLNEEKVQSMIAALQDGNTKILMFKKKERKSDSQPHWDLLLVKPRQ